MPRRSDLTMDDVPRLIGKVMHSIRREAEKRHQEVKRPDVVDATDALFLTVSRCTAGFILAELGYSPAEIALNLDNPGKEAKP